MKQVTKIFDFINNTIHIFIVCLSHAQLQVSPDLCNGGENHPHMKDMKTGLKKTQVTDLCRIVNLRTLVKEYPTGVILLNFLSTSWLSGFNK